MLKKRVCRYCQKEFAPSSDSTVYCSVECAQDSVTSDERRAAERVFARRIARSIARYRECIRHARRRRARSFEPVVERVRCRSHLPESCPVCCRPWRKFLYKTRGGLWRCFVRYHYDTPFGDDLIKAKLAGTATWIYTCRSCNQLEKTIRRRSPERWPYGIPPLELSRMLEQFSK